MLCVGAATESAAPYIGRDAWFIATLIGAIGSLVWLALCILGIFVYRRCRRCGRFNKASSLAGPPFSDFTHLKCLFILIVSPALTQLAVCQ